MPFSPAGVNVAITGRNETDLSQARRHIEGAGPAAVVGLGAPFDPALGLQLVDQRDHCRAIDAEKFGCFSLREAMLLI